MKITRSRIATLLRNRFNDLIDQNVLDYYSNLGCCCGISSYYLHKLFLTFGYNSTLVYGEFLTDVEEYGTTQFGGIHCWVTSNGRIFDITATQFDIEEEVFIPTKQDLVARDIYYKYLKDVHNTKLFQDWDIKPTRRLHKLLYQHVVRELTKPKDKRVPK